MRIGLLGYGKMGRVIEELARERGHVIAWVADRDSRAALDAEKLRSADVVIEFSTPDAAVENIRFCAENKVPVVVGTTGWYARFAEIKEYIQQEDAALFYATNFSIGVNIFWEMNRILSGIMNEHRQYSALLEEIHHIHKLDEPSGTGITTAEGIIAEHDSYTQWALGREQATGTLPVASLREGEVPGTHRVVWTSAEDRIVLEHEAFGRKGFASGAILAAEWLAGKKGVFTMNDLLKG